MSMDNSMMVFFLSMLATYSIVGFVWWLLHVVAAWRIFTKAGEAGWKSIIPIYSTYITYKISWKKKNLFWATLAATVLAFVLSPFSIQADGSINYAMFFIAMLLLLFAFVVNILLVVRKCRAFGHGVGFAIGMLFFEPIFMLILGFGSSGLSRPAGLMPFQITYKRQKAAAGTPAAAFWFYSSVSMGA